MADNQYGRRTKWHDPQPDRHAIVKVSGFTIPLIGLPPDATTCECDLCHNQTHLSDLVLEFNGRQFLCRKCRK